MQHKEEWRLVISLLKPPPNLNPITGIQAILRLSVFRSVSKVVLGLCRVNWNFLEDEPCSMKFVRLVGMLTTF
jgi:hypothetical protein